MIRKAVPEDAQRLAEIHVFGWRSAYRNIVSDHFLFSKMSVQRSAERFKAAIETGDEEHYVCEHQGIIQGFMIVGPSRDEDRKESFELRAIYVEPCMRRQGIGTILIRECESIALKQGWESIAIWVLKENISSRAFYEAHGYRFEGREDYLKQVEAYEVRYIKMLTDKPSG